MGDSSDVVVTFPGGLQVEARVGPHRVLTDQPLEAGGAGAAPSPYALFLASLASCAGFFMLKFCRARSLDAAGLTLRQHVETDPETKAPTRVTLAVDLPPGFPAKYRQALLRAAEQCTVQRAIAARPEIVVAVAEPAPVA